MATVAKAPSSALPTPVSPEEVFACHECGTVHRLPPMPDDTVAKCVSCGAQLYVRFERSIERTLSLYLAALILFLGLAAIVNLPVRQYPEVEETVITVTTTYPGASAAVVVNDVALPVELQVNGSLQLEQA